MVLSKHIGEVLVVEGRAIDDKPYNRIDLSPESFVHLVEPFPRPLAGKLLRIRGQLLEGEAVHHPGDNTDLTYQKADLYRFPDDVRVVYKFFFFKKYEIVAVREGGYWRELQPEERP